MCRGHAFQQGPVWGCVGPRGVPSAPCWVHVWLLPSHGELLWAVTPGRNPNDFPLDWEGQQRVMAPWSPL